VENLVNKGVPVRALVRDVNKARKIKQLDNAELVVGDVYKYETVKQALGDSNVVICAIGLQGFTLDLLQTYKVHNLPAISSHRNLWEFYNKECHHWSFPHS
jgi:putative NADH-flavin reductase